MMKRILIIEDDISIRENLYDLLETHNYEVITASSGEKGVQLAKIKKPDLILCDIMMPGMDGYTVKKNLETDKNISCIPFIFLTAKAELKDLREGMKLGADDYIIKPFDNEDLLNSIKIRLKKVEDIISQRDGTESREKITSRDKILLQVNNQPMFVKLIDIIYINSEGNYSRVHLERGTKLFVRKLMKEWEGLLPKNDFVRIHQSTIIHLNHLLKIEKLSNRSYLVKLKNVEKPLPVSQRYTSKIKARFEI